MLTMGGVGVVLLAAPLLLTMQFAALSNRPEVTIQSSLEGSLYPANFASLAVPNVFGSLKSTQDYWGPNYDTLPEVGATDRSFNYLFVGVAPTIVLLWFGVAGGLLARRDNRLMAGVLLVAALYTMGRYSPLYGFAFNYVPGIDLFRRPIDGSFVLVIAIALLVGPAARHLRPRGRAACAGLATGGGGGRSAGRDRLGGGVLREVAPRTGVPGRGGEGRSDCAAGDRGRWRGRAPAQARGAGGRAAGA